MADKMVRELSNDCIEEMGRLLCDNCGPGSKELAAKLFRDSKDIDDLLARPHCDNLGSLVLRRYAQLPDSTVAALEFFLRDLRRMDVIRIMKKYLHDPCSYILVVKDEQYEVLYQGMIHSFAKETIRDAVTSVDDCVLQNIPFDEMEYVGETKISGSIGDTLSSVFKGIQLSMKVGQRFRPRAVTESQIRPKVHMPARKCFSQNVGISPSRRGVDMSQEHVYEELCFSNGHDWGKIKSKQASCDSGMDEFGDGMFGSLNSRRHRPLPERPDSVTSADSGLTSTKRSTLDHRDSWDEAGDGSIMVPIGFNVASSKTEDRLSPDSLEEDPNDTQEMISLHSDPPSMVPDYCTTYEATPSGDYMTPPGVENVYENIEPPAFHSAVQTKEQTAEILKPYRDKDNHYFTRKSSDKINRTICVTYKSSIVYYRIINSKSMLRGKCVHKYTLYEDKGPEFSSYYALYDYYRQCPMGGVMSGDGPRLLHAVNPRT